MLPMATMLNGKMESSRQTLNPTLEPRKQKDTKRTGEYPQMMQTSPIAPTPLCQTGAAEANLRNLWNLWTYAPAPLHSASCLRGHQSRNRGQVDWSSEVLLTGSPEAAEDREPRSRY
jgi:hypothetical protein